MSKQKKESFFWASYSDLMTSLFFVMLVLFILVIVLLHNKLKEVENERNVTQTQLEKISEIERSVEKINPDYFDYDTQFKRHTLKNISVSFSTGSSNIYDIPQNDLARLYEVGHTIKNFVSEAAATMPNIRYLLIVEGQSSRDNYSYNYQLSYARALALVKFWESRGIVFKDGHCEIIISGSGQESLFRVEPDIAGNRANQRFVIHIIPKTGVIE